jgi:hypothetical protein
MQITLLSYLLNGCRFFVDVIPNEIDQPADSGNGDDDPEIEQGNAQGLAAAQPGVGEQQNEPGFPQPQPLVGDRDVADHQDDGDKQEKIHRRCRISQGKRKEDKNYYIDQAGDQGNQEGFEQDRPLVVHLNIRSR